MPADINKWLDLCAKAESAGDYAGLLEAGEHLVRLAPDRPEPYYICGLALHHLRRRREAIAAYRRVLEISPHYLNALINLGHEHQELNELDEAEGAYRRAIEVSGQSIEDENTRFVRDDEYGLEHWNLAVVQLLQGDLRSGFARYPARYKLEKYSKRMVFVQPPWRGEELKEKSILVTVDQGHGDTLMMARYLPLLRKRGAKVFLHAQPDLVPYLRGWEGVDAVLEWGRDALPSFDYYAREFDLPRFFGTTLDNVPAQIPYLPFPAPDEATRLPDNGNLKVGVTWCGFAGNAADGKRSVPLKLLKPVFEVLNAKFYALARDKRDGDEELLAAWQITDLGSRMSNFLATARFVAQLDLVITCDTSIAHLAGGMGKKVWLMLPFAPSWAWMLNREDSPWYPTMRLFRQTNEGDWADVANRIASGLSSL